MRQELGDRAATDYTARVCQVWHIFFFAPGFNLDPSVLSNLWISIENDVAEPRRALTSRPFVELIEERARLARRARRWNRSNDAAPFDDLLERVGGDIVPDENLRHVGDVERVAQVRLVGAVFAHRLRVGNARPGRRRDGLAARELFKR